MDSRSNIIAHHLGLLCLERTTSIPHVRSLYHGYKDMYGIDLADAMRASNKEWVLPWAHMLGACAQINAVTKEDRLKSLSPGWLSQVCMSILRRYGTVEVITEEAAWEDVVSKNAWLADRMLLSPLSLQNQEEQDEAKMSRDIVALQVTLLLALCFVQVLNFVCVNAGHKLHQQGL